ncbi:hypothetical protein E1258_23335 [Micromonospora sp. KC207]|uniref:hypothetical protein n=1 Tax=Micromonospora sp. KC207 TaxID=2530377 RepID=UPI001049A939|nr:hypothetical protein [Micromonospora sp. KC207]TDC54875.1 hypothetical protein E1258_23335 [Micromonospora sp. KC207]
MWTVGSRRSQASAGIFRHRVGNALVLHSDERISVEARSLALAVAEDPDHDIVVLDLHHDLPVGTWRSVAAALKGSRRGIRLVVCGASADTGAIAAQWLCDRLRRPVVTPHGRTVRAVAGTLFADTAAGSGWVRYRPGRTPVWESQRYPAPAWDAAAARFRPTSAVGAVEPIPGGVWIRDTRDPAVVSGRWQWLTAALPCQPEAMTVVLGCPGTPPLAIDDVARFWRELDPDGRRHARFVQYGPVQLPAGGVLGQQLADVLESPVVCFGGIPVGRPDRAHMHTVTPDGRLGWQVLVRELCFTPRTTPGAAAKLPRILSHHAPALLGEPVGPLAHRYAADAVVEIVQSGLWIRADDTPRNAGRIRAHPADPTRHALIVDDTVPSRVPRFRELAEDLAARLDPATRARSTLHLASAVAAGRRERPPYSADAGLGDGLTYRFTAADLALAEPVEVAPPPAEALAVMAVPGPQSPSWVPAATSGLRAVTGGPTLAAADFLTAPVTDPGAAVPVRVSPPGTAAPSEIAPSASAGGTGTLAGRPTGTAGGRLAPVAPPSPPVAPPSRPVAAPPYPFLAPPAPVRTRTASGRPADPSVVAALWDQSDPVDAPHDTPDAPARPAFATPATSRDVRTRAWSTATRADPAVVRDAMPTTRPAPTPVVLPVDRPARTPVDRPATPQTRGPAVPSAVVPAETATCPPDALRRPLRFQTTPPPDAQGLPTSNGLDAERLWLRQRFSQEFDVAASSISRLLAEHPRLHTGDGPLVDTVAVRLYLSSPGEAVDRALRSGSAGDAVSFARCVAAGVARLPSHRGAACLTATLSADDLREIAARETLTDWGFTHALTEPPVSVPGNVDVLLWSMTARRTRLLEPEDDHRAADRVLFLPGTRFKVLETARPGRDRPGRLLLRELAAEEPVRGRGPFDDLALTSLLRCHERWAATGRRGRVGGATVPRFACLPGIA